MSYIQGFVIPVPTKDKQAFREGTAKFAAILQEFGATRFVSTWGENVPDGKVTDFKRAVAANQDESVVLSWAQWPDRATCDAANQKMQSDERLRQAGASMPFDAKRMIFGGFSLVFDTEE